MAAELNKLDDGRRHEKTTIGEVSVEQWELRDVSSTASDHQIYAFAEALGFPQIGDQNEDGLPLIRRRIRRRLPPNPQLIGGAILETFHGVGGGGGSVQFNQASRISTRRFPYTIPIWIYDGVAQEHYLKRTEHRRVESNRTFTGIVGGLTSPEEAANELQLFLGYRVQINGIWHVLNGGDVVDRPGSLPRYYVEFVTTSRVGGIGFAEFGDSVPAVSVPDLDHLEELVEVRDRGSGPSYVVKGVNQYPLLPPGVLLWVEGLP